MMRKRIGVSQIIMLFLFILFFLTCSEHEQAIFFFIENEEVLAGTNFTEDMTINGMAATTGGLYYYISAGASLWVRQVNTSNWRTVPMPAGTVINNALAAFSPALGAERLYAGFDNGLYYTEDASGQATVTWNKVNTLGDNTVTRMKVVNNNLLVSVRVSETNTSTLYFRDNTSDDFVPVQGLQSISGFINDFIFDGTSYWITSGSNLYTGNLTDVMGIAAVQPPTDDDLVGIIFTAAGNYYISTDNGQVFFSGNTGNWVALDEVNSSDGLVIINQKQVPFLHFGQAPSSIAIPAVYGEIMVGTEGYGFFTIPDGSTVLTRLSVFTLTDLYSGVVDDFFLADPDVFVLTFGSGIWRNTYTPGIGFDNDWTQE